MSSLSSYLWRLIGASLFLAAGAAGALEQDPKTSSGQSPPKEEVRPLVPGEPAVERELSGGEKHSYSLVLEAGLSATVAAEQRGIDVVVTLFGPDGKRLTAMDSPNGTQGPEILFWVSVVAGTHRLEISSPDAKASGGRYELKAQIRPATEPDRARVAGQALLLEAQELSSQETGESRRKAIAKYEESLPLWRAAGDRDAEAETVNLIGFLYYRLGEMNQALRYFEQALAIPSSDAERAKRLGNVGAMHSLIGDLREAVKYQEKALALFRALKDRAS